jgi:hypothetical protein
MLRLIKGMENALSSDYKIWRIEPILLAVFQQMFFERA